MPELHRAPFPGVLPVQANDDHRPLDRDEVLQALRDAIAAIRDVEPDEVGASTQVSKQEFGLILHHLTMETPYLVRLHPSVRGENVALGMFAGFLVLHEVMLS